jgi:hypothetical protein
MKKEIKLLVITIICLALPGCSVFMAAQKKGISFEDISVCDTRMCLLSKGATLIKSEKGYDIFKADKPSGSSSRAAMHGVLDVATMGIWEVAGTPIEGSMDKGMYYFKATYKADETIKTIEIAK